MELEVLLKKISIDIWRKIKLSVELGEVFHEVSITDFFWEQLYVHSTQRTTIAARRKLDKPESVTGADLELWLVDEKLGKAIGLRIQAKIINARGNQYPQLSHKVKNKGDQTTILLDYSMHVEKMIPLYVFYNFFPNEPDKEEYGMTFAYAHDIYNLKRNSNRPSEYKKVKNLEPYTLPFFHFFCPPDIEVITEKFKEKTEIYSGEINKFYRELDKLPSYVEILWKNRPLINYAVASAKPKPKPKPKPIESNGFSEEFLKDKIRSISKSKLGQVIKSMNNKYGIQDKYDLLTFKMNRKNAASCCVDFPKGVSSNTAYILVISL